MRTELDKDGIAPGDGNRDLVPVRHVGLQGLLSGADGLRLERARFLLRLVAT